MCFSATASFTAAGLLTLLGAIGIKKAHTRSLKLFASTPLLFALQQTCEGIMWITASHNQQLFVVAMYCFVFFAGLFWPVWVPMVLYALENRPIRKKLFYVPIISGITFSIYALVNLIQYGVVASIEYKHIAYSINPLPYGYTLAHLLYLIAVITPCFISSLERMWLFGVGIIGTYGITYWWFNHHFASVWCFFAALLSGLILYIVMCNNRISR